MVIFDLYDLRLKQAKYYFFSIEIDIFKIFKQKNNTEQIYFLLVLIHVFNTLILCLNLAKYIKIYKISN